MAFREDVVRGNIQRVLECNLAYRRLQARLADRHFDCNAVFNNMDMQDSCFDRISVLTGGIYFNGANLRNTSWKEAKTSEITFLDVDLTGSNITLEQLAHAKWVDPKSRFPEGIDYRAIMECRQKLQLPPFAAVKPPQP